MILSGKRGVSFDALDRIAKVMTPKVVVENPATAGERGWL